MSNLIRIIAPHFVAGAEMRKGVVTNCAPIIKYMKGWSYRRVQSYCKYKKWEYEVYK